MNCREFVEFLMAYVNNDLAESEAGAFRQHISDCPPCIHFLESYRETLALEKEAYQDEEMLFDQAPENLVRAILVARTAARDSD